MNRIVDFVGRSINYLLLKELRLTDKIRVKFSPRNTVGEITVYNKKIRYSDKYTFLSMYKELFIKEIYAFKSKTATPLIIDCGANIGLSVMYFKKLYPKARIIAFEPDKEIFAMLQENIGAFAFSDVTLKLEAVWVNNDTLHFQSQGGLSGRLTGQTSGEHIIDVKGFRLKELLNQPVDFLKIDIEGAEYRSVTGFQRPASKCCEHIRGIPFPQRWQAKAG